jgi:HD-like signal output (HDOD) protein
MQANGHLPARGAFVHHGRWYTEFLVHVRLARPSGACRAESEPLCNRVDAAIRDGRYRVPVLPDTATEILRLTQDPGVHIERIVALLEREQAITARLLALANSPMFRGTSAFRSGKDAVIRLGLKTVRDLVMQGVVMSKVFDVQRFIPRMKDLRVHATGVAFAGRTLEAVAGRKNDWAFMAGLMHDLGKPTLLALIADVKNIDAVHQGALDELLALRHAAAGAVVAERMNLPAPIVRSIARHHAFDVGDAEDELSVFVSAGDLLWRAAVDGRRESRDRLVDSVSAQRLGIGPDRVDRALAQMIDAKAVCTAAAT